jgi:hypothetical protein
MPYPKEFPQQVLGLNRTAISRQDLKIALGRALKKDPKNAKKITEAFKTLSDKKKRLEYEVLLPQSGEALEKELLAQAAKLTVDEFLSATIPALPVPQPLYEIQSGLAVRDFSNCVIEEVAIQVPAYPHKSLCLPVYFDK